MHDTERRFTKIQLQIADHFNVEPKTIYYEPGRGWMYTGFGKPCFLQSSLYELQCTPMWAVGKISLERGCCE